LSSSDNSSSEGTVVKSEGGTKGVEGRGVEGSGDCEEGEVVQGNEAEGGGERGSIAEREGVF
jgi:hypothetical protein